MSYNKLIDHTLLKPDAMPEQIIKLCEEAKEFDFNIFETASSDTSEYLEAIDADIYHDDILFCRRLGQSHCRYR